MQRSSWREAQEHTGSLPARCLNRGGMQCASAPRLPKSQGAFLQTDTAAVGRRLWVCCPTYTFPCAVERRKLHLTFQTQEMSRRWRWWQFSKLPLFWVNVAGNGLLFCKDFLFLFFILKLWRLRSPWNQPFDKINTHLSPSGDEDTFYGWLGEALISPLLHKGDDLKKGKMLHFKINSSQQVFSTWTVCHCSLILPDIVKLMLSPRKHWINAQLPCMRAAVSCHGCTQPAVAQHDPIPVPHKQGAKLSPHSLSYICSEQKETAFDMWTLGTRLSSPPRSSALPSTSAANVRSTLHTHKGQPSQFTANSFPEVQLRSPALQGRGRRRWWSSDPQIGSNCWACGNGKKERWRTGISCCSLFRGQISKIEIYESQRAYSGTHSSLLS